MLFIIHFFKMFHMKQCIIQIKREEMEKHLGKLLIFLALFGMAFMGKLLFFDSNDTQKFCKRYIPVLETYYKQNKSYPHALREVTLHEDREKNIDKRCSYYKDEVHFEFTFSDGWFGVVGYDSRDKQW